MDPKQTRPDPDALLSAIKREEEELAKGKLKIFFGMSAGVGKTYGMLKAAHEERKKGTDIVIGYVETHGRPETEALVEGLEIVPRRLFDHRGTTVEEMDIDAVISRKPTIALVDELAHSNAPGSRHPKRYQDVVELLENGIDVYTTLNVQHIESRADTVAQITGALVRETVPDSIFSLANEVEIIDIPPDELLQRLAEGKVYTPERSARAIESFFRKGNLTALREMALRLTAERVDHQLREYMRGERILGPWKSGQRIIVAISPSPHTTRVIRWARRTAYSLKASWVAVYVEGQAPLSEPAQKQLAENIRLAREMGAEVVTTADTSVHKGLLRIAAQENATQILVGRSAEQAPFWRDSLLDKLVKSNADLDIYVVAGEQEKLRPARMSFSRIASWRQYAAATAAIVSVAALCFPFRNALGYQTVSLFLILTITLLSLKLRVGPMLLAASLSALIWDFFFIPPLYTFQVALGVDVLMLCTYFIIAIVTGSLSARSRANENALRQREERASALFSLTKELSKARSVDGVVHAAVLSLNRFFAADVVIYLGTPEGDFTNTPHPASTMPMDEKEFSVAAWAYWNEKKAGRFTDTLPSARAVYYPLTGPRYSLGVIGIRQNSEKPLPLDQETLLQNFIDQISSALERESLNDVSAKAMVVTESERLYKAIFDSISHEIRTPLAAIAGSAEGLLDEKLAGEPGVRRQFARDIHSAAERLNRLVENLLDMTRLESGLLRPQLDWCDLRDIVNSALKRAAQELQDRPIHVDIPGDMPLLRLDYGLIEQAFVNILHNAAVYSELHAPVDIRVAIVKGECTISIADAGAGIPPGMEERIFEKFFRVPGAKTGGTGLGLSIVKGFVQAHQGTIIARNRPSGGAEFVIHLPVDTVSPA